MAHKRVAIVQSSYIPWKGYFDLIRASDEFILLDNVQFTRRDWRSRNRIKTSQGLAWLTVPVHSKGLYRQQIREVTVSDPEWGARHWETLRTHYGRAPFFRYAADALEPLYRAPASNRLSDINHALIIAVCRLLNIGTRITWATDYAAREGRNERLIDLCVQSGASEYLSGPTAAAYVEVDAFRRAGMTVTFADYAGYPEYPQLHPPFEHAVTVLDLLFNTGPRACEFMKAVVPAPSQA
jgi:hypothetical protein